MYYESILPNLLDSPIGKRKTINVDLGAFGKIRLDGIRIVANANEPNAIVRVRFYRRQAELSYDSDWQEIIMVD